MKQLTCEMCGSTELLKLDGVFVCQTCGCKYSVEEAKKMMVEGTVEVTGTVKVDKNPEIEALLDKAYYYLETKKYDAKKKCISMDRNEAKNLFNKVHDIDPTNAQAYLGKILCDNELYYIEEIPLLKERKQDNIKSSENYDLFMRYATLDEKEKMEFCFNNETPIDELIKLLIEKNKGVFDSFILNYLLNESEEREIDEFIVPDNVISIGDYAFYSQYHIKRVKIPNGVTKIGNGAFSNCKDLKNVNIPDSVVAIGMGAFSKCWDLKNINIPNSVKTIGERAFMQCWHLENVNISNSVTEIGNDAFSNCSDLKNVNIPDSVVTIGDGAFSECYDLENISIPSNTVKIHSKAFLESFKIKFTVDENNKKYSSVNGRLCDKNGNVIYDSEIALTKYIIEKLGRAEEALDKEDNDEEYNGEEYNDEEDNVKEFEEICYDIICTKPTCASAYLGKAAAIAFTNDSYIKESVAADTVKNIMESSKYEIKADEQQYVSYLISFKCGKTKASLLHYAVSNVNYEAVEYLIKLGADVNARGEFSGTPLWRLCHKPLPQNKEAEGRKIAKILLDNGAEINVSYNEVQLLNSFTDIEIRKMILEKYPNAKVANSGGCYVATCVYGSYDCPQVWTLRRYRDDTLGATWYGRLFIRTYYAISPTLVKWFGKTNWFKKLWKGKLDRMVAKLQSKGVDNTPYDDKEW